MSEAMIYLVTSGAYSDYGVNAVFSTRELAEAWIAAELARMPMMVDRQSDRIVSYSGDDYNIEEQALNPEPAHPLTAEHGAWVARRGLGNGQTNDLWIEWKDGERARPGEITITDSKSPPYRRIQARGYGETPEHALRAMRELERAIKAGTIVVPND
ncbi:MAG: hypothetical protein ACR2KM_04145 [Gemmatimonadaceae bacterium]